MRWPILIFNFPWFVVVLLVLFCGINANIRAQSEDAVKCALVYNFAKFVTWPEKAFSAPSSPISIGFVGGAALAESFTKAVKGKNAAGRDIEVKQLTGSGGAEACQIVYIVDPAQVGPVAGALKGKPILIVGDADTLLDAGGIIRFFNDGGKVAFEVNAAAAKDAELRLDPKLLNIAKSSKGNKATP